MTVKEPPSRDKYCLSVQPALAVNHLRIGTRYFR